MSGIGLKWLVDVNSTASKDSYSLGKLNTILITQYDVAFPNDRWGQFFSASQVYDAFGFGSQNNFAKNYFGFTSKKATKADLLTVYVWNKTATPAALIGGVLPSINVLKTLNGAFRITIGKASADISVNLTSAVSYSDVAALIKAALNAVTNSPDFKTANVVYSEHKQGLIVTSGVSGSASSISFVTAATQGTDISSYLRLSASAGAKIVKGYDQMPDLQSVLDEMEKKNGPYFVITTDFVPENETDFITKLGQFVKNSNNRYLGLYLTSNQDFITGSSAGDAYKSFDGLMLEYSFSNNQYGISAGIISALDFSQINGNYNLAFNEVDSNVAIEDEKALNNLEVNLCNSVIRFGQMGQSQVVYGMGNIYGSLTNSANVYIGNAYLSLSLQVAVSNMFVSQPMIGVRGNQSEGIIRSYLDQVFSGAVNSGIIAQGAEITNTESQAIYSAFGDLGENAVKQLKSLGYFYAITKFDLSKKIISVSTSYVANTPAKKVVINNFVLGA